MTLEQILAKLDTPRVQADAGAMLEQQSVTERPAEPVAGVITKDRTTRGDHQSDVDLVRRPRIDGGE
jgi:hypothetical protein